MQVGVAGVVEAEPRVKTFSHHDMTTGEAVIENSVRTMHVNRQLRHKSIHRPPPRESSRRLRRGVGLPAAGLVAGEGDRIPSELGGQVSRRVTDARGIY